MTAHNYPTRVDGITLNEWLAEIDKTLKTRAGLSRDQLHAPDDYWRSQYRHGYSAEASALYTLRWEQTHKHGRHMMFY